MCLDVNYKLHGRGKKFAPKVSKVPILVWKSLECSNGTHAMSPFQYHRWFFGKQETAELIITRYGNSISVQNGLHAHALSEAQRKDKSVVRRYLRSGETLWDVYGKLYPAIIPAGTKFVVGTSGDIVAEALTVYTSEEKMFAALGITELAPGINHNNIATW